MVVVVVDLDQTNSLDFRNRPFATGSSQQQVRPCWHAAESGNKLRALAATPKAMAG
jgi:hypothetical protein